MSISDAVAKASAYLAEHPEEARYRDSFARARVESGLVVTVTGPGGESLTTDMPAGIGGTAVAPSPGWFLRAAAASCVASRSPFARRQQGDAGVRRGGGDSEYDDAESWASIGDSAGEL